MNQETVVKVPKVLPYSYSSLTSFETCPLKHYEVKVAKTTPPQEYKQATDGIDVHKQAEDYINKVTDHVDGPYAPKIIARVEQLRYNDEPIYAEKQLCVTRDMKPCDWKDPNAHARGVLDMLQIVGTEATIDDWKTGKPDPFSTQLKHNSLLVFIHNPQVEVVHTRYIWLKTGYDTKNKVSRDFLQADWNKFEDRVHKLEEALEKNKWPAKKSGLCRNYCPVVTCEHNGGYQK